MQQCSNGGRLFMRLCIFCLFTSQILKTGICLQPATAIKPACRPEGERVNDACWKGLHFQTSSRFLTGVGAATLHLQVWTHKPAASVAGCYLLIINTLMQQIFLAVLMLFQFTRCVCVCVFWRHIRARERWETGTERQQQLRNTGYL